ncbi:MAG TPA: DUF2076 domain-containing protein [Rhodopila sp.]|nr:DUF2076 domain-containing protein [Rhodopila sp.]
MTNEERDIIGQFIARVGGANAPSGFAAGSVPATTQPALPPVDRDADAFIGQLFTQYPDARYRITQLAFVQEHALVEAQNRIRRLEWEVQQARQAAQQAQQSAPRSGGGLFGGLFGGGRQQPPGAQWNQQGGAQGNPQWNQGGQQQYYQQSAPPPPQYPPNYQQGMFQRQGSGFLGSALTTAAGVAGGMVVGNALMDMFSPHRGGFGGGLGEAGAAASPWATPAASPDAVDTGTWDTGGGGAPANNQDYVDNSGWDTNSAGGAWDTSGGNDNSGWDQGSGGDAGGWDQGGGGGWDSGGGTDDTI